VKVSGYFASPAESTAPESRNEKEKSATWRIQRSISGENSMRHKAHFLLYIIITTLLLSPLFSGNAIAAATQKKAMILFDDIKGDEGSRASALQIANLLGHFGISTYLAPISLYEKGDMKKYPYIFLAGCQTAYPMPDSLLEEIASSKDKFFWIGNHIEQLLKKNSAKRFDMESAGVAEGYPAVNYKGSLLSRGNPRINVVRTGKKVMVHAWAVKPGGEEKIPYIMQNENFWYVADLPFSYVQGIDRYLAFCDLLHDFLGENHKTKYLATVRIEDVSPTSDPEKIKEIADILSSLNVPFQISLVPVHIDPETEQEIPLSSRPRLVGALKYATARGGTIVLHGFTHQYKGASTLDSEFWDEEGGKPVREDSPQYVEKRLKGALDECFRCNIYPLAWETPQYVASTLDYRTIARHFSTVSERRIFFNQFSLNQSFPFIIEKDIFGQRIIPEYLGYVPFVAGEGGQDINAEKAAAGEIVKNAKNMRCLRDCVAGFFFHPFLDPSILKDMVTDLKGAGFEFLDVRDFDNTVTFGDRIIISGKGNVRFPVKDKFLRESYFDEKRRNRKEKITHSKLNSVVKRSISCRPRWIYVAEGIDRKPGTALDRLISDFSQQLAPNHIDERQTARAAIVWNDKAEGPEAMDQQAFLHSCEIISIPIRKIDAINEIKDENLLIIPHASAAEIKEAEHRQLSGFIDQGGVVVLDGFSDLSRSLGFTRAGKVDIKEVKDVYNAIGFFTSGVMEIATPATRDKVAFQSNDGFPLGLLRREKEGGIFFLSTLYDPDSGEGYSRFPTLINITLDFFRLTPPRAVPRIEAYFDPGLRQSESVETLARRWRKNGIRTIHVGTWHFYPTYTFDYRRLIKVCHKQGINVYAWLELPYLTKDFWDKHPEFREKNLQGKDLHVSWRYPLAIEDPACREAVCRELEKLFSDYDFDGVNLAEIYFEGEGLSKPGTYSPFHPWALRDFKKRYSFAMKEIFTPSSAHYYQKDPDSLKTFYAYRQEQILTLHREMLSFLRAIKKEQKNFEIVVTVMDSLSSPYVSENFGVDSLKIAALMNDFPFTLAVEDPLPMWDRPPVRYDAIKDAYLKAGVDSSRLAVDLNVVDVHKPKGNFATARQTGIELFGMLRAASRGGNRVLLYAESSVFDCDLPYLANAVEAPADVIFPAPQKAILDPLHLIWTSGDLLKSVEGGGKNIIEYDSPAANYVALNREPMGVWLDGNKYRGEIFIGDGEWILTLPSGRHGAVILGESRLLFDVEVFSYHEAKILFFFGLFSCGLLLLVMTFNRLGRKKKHA
jgi:uncharacterized protein YdaL